MQTPLPQSNCVTLLWQIPPDLSVQNAVVRLTCQLLIPKCVLAGPFGDWLDACEQRLVPSRLRGATVGSDSRECHCDSEALSGDDEGEPGPVPTMNEIGRAARENDPDREPAEVMIPRKVQLTHTVRSEDMAGWCICLTLAVRDTQSSAK
eukprot:COSAG04_NODE_8033_length_1032_cov_1.006431_1_plen_150_part_00